MTTTGRFRWLLCTGGVAFILGLGAPHLARKLPFGGDSRIGMQVGNPATQPSLFLSHETLVALSTEADAARQKSSPCPDIAKADKSQAAAIRACEVNDFYQSALYQRMRDRYSVSMSPQSVGGVYTQVFTPTEGVSPENQKRVLINLHGGGFVDGSRTQSVWESMPIASVGRFKIVSIDYRQAPEYAFPAASEDVVAVYKELLKTYAPKDIGIFGCSAGALLTAEAVTWLAREGLPAPGAIGMFCDGAGYWTEGDTGYVHHATSSEDPIWASAHNNPYFKNVDLNDPLAFPIRSAAIMAAFPPSLLISATHDPALSCVVYTHSVLTSHGVDAELHVWEGMRHAFFSDPDLPESREAYDVVVKFFDKHLGH